MSTDTAVRVGEHAHGTSSDRIVLDSEQLRTALGWAVQTPGYVVSAQAERDDLGLDTDPLLRAMLAEAAAFAIANRLVPVDKPAPTVTSTTTTRVLPAILTDLDGNRFLDAVSYRFSFVEHPEPGDFEFVPHVVADADPTMDEHEFVRFAADADRFARAITAPLESSWNAAGAA